MSKVFAISSGIDIRLLNELISFSDKGIPNILIIPHSQINCEDKIYETMKGYFHNTKVFSSLRKKGFTKHFDTLTCYDLNDSKKVSELLSWADIYYVPPGDTLAMLDLWNEKGFSEKLIEMSDSDKVFAGTSAGANCWFSSFTTLTNEGIKSGVGINLVDAHMTPHGDELYVKKFHKSVIENNDILGFCMVKDTALAVVGDSYRIIVPKRYEGFSEATTYPLVTGYNNGNYYCNEIDKTTGFYREGKILVKK